MKFSPQYSPDRHDAALAHVVNRVMATPVETNPFPHGAIEELFPLAYYQQMLALLPTPAELEPVQLAGEYEARCKLMTGVEGFRRHLWLADFLQSPSTSPERDLQHEFWEGFANRFVSPAFVSALTHRFSSVACSNLEVALRFVRETGAVYIGPHLDRPEKLMSVVCYLGAAAELGAQGTSLYVTGKDGLPELTKVVPFLQNSAVVLPRTAASLHGVEPHRLQTARATLHLYLQEPGKNARGVYRPK